MNELALFAGAGGGLLASRLLGWRTVCAVEFDGYRRAVLAARQDDGSLEPFPIWDDVRTFDGLPWRGRVDVVSGGFPCQAYSSAARGRNTTDDLWPEMRRIVAEVAPRYVFAENVGRRAIDRAADEARPLNLVRDHGPAAVAEEAAEHHYNRHDGWEDDWPITFAVLMPDGTEHRVTVDRIMSPHFYATVVHSPGLHRSDCAVNNGPALPVGPCDCGASK